MREISLKCDSVSWYIWVLLNWMLVANPVTVATTICFHGCQSWALVSENGGWACQNPFKPQAEIFFSLQSKVMCHCMVCKCVQVLRSFQEDLYYSLYLDNGSVPPLSVSDSLTQCQSHSILYWDHWGTFFIIVCSHHCIIGILLQSASLSIALFLYTQSLMCRNSQLDAVIYMLCSYYLLKCASCCLQHRIE